MIVARRREAVDADPATMRAFGVLYRTDPATNCLPSLHVSLALLGATSFWPDRPRLAVAALVWAALITASTLTIKQHYMIDVLAGLVLAAAAGRFARALAPQPSPQAGKGSSCLLSSPGRAG